VTAEEVHVSTPTDRHVPELMNDMTAQITHLVKSEVALAAHDLRIKAKRGGLAAGLGAVAAASSLIGAIALAAAAIFALSYLLPAWLSALIVGAALIAVGAAAAVAIKFEVSKATPLVPEKTIDNLREDVKALKGTS